MKILKQKKHKAGSGETGGTAAGNAELSVIVFGGGGGVGRIHIDYSDSYTGTTSPTLSTRQDATLDYPTTGGAFLYNFV